MPSVVGDLEVRLDRVALSNACVTRSGETKHLHWRGPGVVAHHCDSKWGPAIPSACWVGAKRREGPRAATRALSPVSDMVRLLHRGTGTRKSIEVMTAAAVVPVHLDLRAEPEPEAVAQEGEGESPWSSRITSHGRLIKPRRVRWREERGCRVVRRPRKRNGE